MPAQPPAYGVPIAPQATRATVPPALPPKPWGEESEKAGAKPQRPQPPKQEDSVASQEARGEGRQEIERLRVNHRYQVT